MTSKLKKNDRKIYQHFQFKGPTKYSQIGIFGMKIYRPATLLCNLYPFAPLEQ
jgi:hypothetical protein